jgi:hypothetical protein
LEVTLEAEWIFRFSKVFQELIEIIQEDPKLFDTDSDSIREGKTINRVIQRLLSDLIPIRGRAIDYLVIQLDEDKVVIHRNLYEYLMEHGIADSRAFSKEELYIVGLTERTLYWRNIRQVLFSNARFRVMCRMEQPGIQSSWSSLKLQDVLNSVFPEVGEVLDKFKSEAAFNKMSVGEEHAGQRSLDSVHEMLLTYTTSLTADYELSLEARDLSEIEGIIIQNAESLETIAGRKQACVQISEYLSSRFGFDLNPEWEADRRLRVAEALENFAGTRPEHMEVESTETVEPLVEENLLDTEIIAIYW